MLSITLKLTDCIETVLPAVQAAMDSGQICELRNIDYLGPFELAALKLLVMSTGLRDSESGAMHHAHHGFKLIGIDEQGLSRCLAG